MSGIRTGSQTRRDGGKKALEREDADQETVRARVRHAGQRLRCKHHSVSTRRSRALAFRKDGAAGGDDAQQDRRLNRTESASICMNGTRGMTLHSQCRRVASLECQDGRSTVNCSSRAFRKGETQIVQLSKQSPCSYSVVGTTQA